MKQSDYENLKKFQRQGRSPQSEEDELNKILKGSIDSQIVQEMGNYPAGLTTPKVPKIPEESLIFSSQVEPTLSVTDKIRMNQEKAAIEAGKARFDELERIRELEKAPVEVTDKVKFKPFLEKTKQLYQNEYDNFFPTDEEIKLMTREERTNLKNKANLAAKKQDIFEKKLAGTYVPPARQTNNFGTTKESPNYAKNLAASNERSKRLYAQKSSLTLAGALEEQPDLRSKYPFLSDPEFENYVIRNYKKGLSEPTEYLKNTYDRTRDIKKGAGEFESWLSKFKGFGGDKILKSFGAALPFVGVGAALYAGRPDEAMAEGLETLNPIPGLDFGEQLGPPKGSQDYYIEHPWDRQADYGGMFNSQNQ